MNTSKQVNAMLGLFFVFLVGTFLYFLWDTGRAEEAQLRQTRVNAERGAELYALNCRSCHGLTGQGPLERTGLPGAPLNIEASRPDTAGALNATQQRFTDTIHCGRIGTVMPPWSQEQGGPLNFFQIEQLVTLITGAKPADQFDQLPEQEAISLEAWDHAYEEANHADEFDPRKFLAASIDAEQTTIPVTSTEQISDDAILRLGGNPEEPDYELVQVTAIDEGANELTVERAFGGTTAMEHEEGTEVFGNFVPPGESITGAEAPVCGQSFSGGPSDGDEAPTVEIGDGDTIDMGDDFFEFDGDRNPSLEVAAGEILTLNLTNGGNNIHNMRISGLDAEYDSDDDFVSDPDIMSSGDEGTIEFSLDEPGTYPYRCDFHPVNMAGEISVVE